MTRWHLDPGYPQSVFDDDGVNVLTRITPRDMRRIAAAPEMEDVLMALLDCHNPKACDICRASTRAALRKSGALP